MKLNHSEELPKNTYIWTMGSIPHTPCQCKGLNRLILCQILAASFWTVMLDPAYSAPFPPTFSPPTFLFLYAKWLPRSSLPDPPLSFATDRILNTSATPLPRGEGREKEEFGGISFQSSFNLDLAFAWRTSAIAAGETGVLEGNFNDGLTKQLEFNNTLSKKI